MTNENLCEWRERLYGEYRRGLDAISQIADKNRSAYWAAAQVNDILKLDKIFIHAIPHLGGVNLPAPVLARLRMGECDDYAFKCAYVMRACGIPVSVDFTLQWPTRPHGHHWNVVLGNNGRSIPFMGSESNPGYPCKSDYVYGKVYRYIRYLPRNDDNRVTAGHRYRLDYYGYDGPRTIGEQTATTDSVTFDNVPSGALYILHDLTKGKEERIFTYESGNVRWW